MATPLQQVQPALTFAARHLDEDLSLGALAEQTGLSAFHLHRIFAAAVGETPKQLTLRLRLGRAAALLLSGKETVLDIALACGFQSHEVFSRAFRRRFGMSPSAYRNRGFAKGEGAAQSGQHAALTGIIGPCIGLYHISAIQRSQMTYSITTKEITAQPVLLVRRRVKRSDIAKMIAESLPPVFLHAQKNGIAIAGYPFARYLDWGPGMTTIEAGVPVAAPSSGEGEVLADSLPGGLVAITTHEGLYDKLTEAHAALQEWIEAKGHGPAGAPWESYVTDPGDCPDPKDWKTEVFWPLKR